MQVFIFFSSMAAKTVVSSALYIFSYIRCSCRRGKQLHVRRKPHLSIIVYSVVCIRNHAGAL